MNHQQDAGAETQANYHYQHCCTARWCVLLLRGSDGVARIRCETHDDFTVDFDDTRSEIVSVKYRGGSSGPWTVPQLVAKAVLHGLFQRWVRLGEVVSCRLMTNAALAPEAKRLSDCCSGQDQEARRQWADRLASVLAGDVEQVGRFLTAMTFEVREVSRANVERVEAVTLRTPLQSIFGVADASDPRYFAAIVALVAAANRAVDPVDVDALDLSLTARRVRRDDARCLDRAKIVGALLDVPREGEPRLVGTTVSAHKATRLVAKLEAGGIPPTTVQSAKLLRAAWSDHEARWRAEVPGGDAEWADLRTRVLHLAAKAERAIDRNRAYGADMLQALESTLTEEALGRSPAMPLSDMLLLGLAYQLTDECRVYWSPKEAVPG